LRIGDTQALEFAGQGFDTVIITPGLCRIPDSRAAVSEAHRVLPRASATPTTGALPGTSTTTGLVWAASWSSATLAATVTMPPWIAPSPRRATSEVVPNTTAEPDVCHRERPCLPLGFGGRADSFKAQPPARAYGSASCRGAAVVGPLGHGLGGQHGNRYSDRCGPLRRRDNHRCPGSQSVRPCGRSVGACLRHRPISLSSPAAIRACRGAPSACGFAAAQP
jgi:hypothetical protein